MVENPTDKSLEDIKYGITTGSGAAAAARAALLVLKGEDVKTVTIKTPLGDLEIEVEYAHKLTDTHGQASVIKRPYNDPDVTVNLEILADVWVNDTEGVTIKGGKGVGLVTKPGLQVPPGNPAINPTPRKMIKENLSDTPNWELKGEFPYWEPLASPIHGTWKATGNPSNASWTWPTPRDTENLFLSLATSEKKSQNGF